ncbi:SDR family NAD(P)-dependent oxidoreductase [Propionivibrio soli]|uniref:SDR family NAD(P)-dependent oxidoreductase n=1 Tax=Propionivibrio soli TaxID=2976531 RepID=UPI0021E88D93|nr:SDR family NAD(P)-dependent oxidoreductase [Propionivibrio soli]
MKTRLKPIAEQVVVITGASSGIGLTTARHAAALGARLVLVSRNAEALGALVQELRRNGHFATRVVADVARIDDVREIAEVARGAFGGIDTWVNNAGISVYGKLESIPLEDQRRLFDTNFWGVVHGSLVAASELRRRGGALINVGSEVSDVALPLQGMYSASKHAVKGFTEPDVVADAIIYAAQHRKRDIYVGAASRLFSIGNRLMPHLMDKYLERFMFAQQRSQRPRRRGSPSALYAAGVGMHERQRQENRVAESSLYTRLTTLDW